MVIEVNGTRYLVKIEDEFDRQIKRMGFTLGDDTRLKDVKAPMPGLVLDILIQPGQVVSKGDHLFILEAMKMENIIKAAGQGVIKSVLTKVGQAVEKGQVMVEME